MSTNNGPASDAKQIFVIDGALPEIDTLTQSTGPDMSILVLDTESGRVRQQVEFPSQESGLKTFALSYSIVPRGRSWVRPGPVKRQGIALKRNWVLSDPPAPSAGRFRSANSV